MSTSYRFNKSVSVEEFLAAVEKTGLKVHTPFTATSNHADYDKACITCGEYYLWFYTNIDGRITDSERYGQNYEAQETILDVLSEALEVGYLSEHDDGYFEDPMGDGDEPKVWP